jgi:hypothetical protein
MWTDQCHRLDLNPHYERTGLVPTVCPQLGLSLSLSVPAETFKIKNSLDSYRKTGSPQVKMALKDQHLCAILSFLLLFLCAELCNYKVRCPNASLCFHQPPLLNVQLANCFSKCTPLTNRTNVAVYLHPFTPFNLPFTPVLVRLKHRLGFWEFLPFVAMVMLGFIPASATSRVCTLIARVRCASMSRYIVW